MIQEASRSFFTPCATLGFRPFYCSHHTEYTRHMTCIKMQHRSFGSRRNINVSDNNITVNKLRGYGYMGGLEIWHLPLKWLVTFTTRSLWKVGCRFRYIGLYQFLFVPMAISWLLCPAVFVI